MPKVYQKNILTIDQLNPDKSYSLRKICINPQLFDDELGLAYKTIHNIILRHKDMLKIYSITRSKKITNFYIPGVTLIEFLKTKPWRNRI